MSWYNPTYDEAEDAYYYYKKKYYDAAEKKQSLKRDEQNYFLERNTKTSEISSLSFQKLNFEKRLEGIARIIKMLEGNAGWFSTNVPAAISKVVSSLSNTEASYTNSIKVLGGAACASLENAFETKSIENDSHSASALQQYKSEKAKLEQELSNLKSRIAALSEEITSLTNQINSCISTQASLQSSMYSFAYEMNHYKKFIV